MNKELLKLLPSDQELAKLSAKTQVVMTSRNELLSQIGTLDLEKMELEEKMVYVLGLVSLGFDLTRARKLLGVSNREFYIYKQDERHETMIENAQARGEMVLEEKVLSEAEKNPKMAFELLKEKQRMMEKKEDRDSQNARTIWDIMQENAKERGIVEGELVDDILE
ncbi:MAG TPA: hypothetical protein PLW74_00380 [Candidatus Dojkabacteria bacterium]|nr:hypothetical protein [Candidatus Dojkabacteria bacterium]